MSTCTKWVDKAVLTCKNWAEKTDYECTTWADEGSNQCSEWADEGHEACAEWDKECKWYKPWNCVVSWICTAYYWVAEWVCKAWYWVAKWVCKAFAWVTKVVCAVFGWVFKLVCVAWDTLFCMITAIIKLLGSLFGRSPAKPKIEHVFVLMLENRAFDHMLGFSSINGSDAQTGQPTTVNGSDPTRDINSGFPVNTPADFTLKDVDKDPGHEFSDTLQQLCGAGAQYPDPVTGGYPAINNSGFVSGYSQDGANTPGRIMNCFSPGQLPILNTLATEFAVCDNWFSSMPGPTFPNRYFAMAATSGGLDDSPSNLDIVVSTWFEGYRFENGNLFDALDGACIPWAIYEGDDFPVSFTLSGMNLNALQGRFKNFSDFESDLQKISFKEKFVFIEPKYGEHKFDILGPGDFTCGNSMHPLDDVTRGERLIKKVYEAIRNSPHWESSALIITFDEHGGFYDHVAPPAAVPPGDITYAGNVHNNFKFDRLGARVPAIVVSPFVKRNVIDHAQFDHTSMLATVEKLFGIGFLTQRDKNANDFLHLFGSVARLDTPTQLPNVANSGFRCDDDETAEILLAIRADLIQAKRARRYRDQEVVERESSPMQIGFSHIALLKMLTSSEYPEREKWKEDFRNIRTEIDAAIFITEAKLKLKYAVDIKKALRKSESPRVRENTRTPKQKLQRD
jgi:phospholipase C